MGRIGLALRLFFRALSDGGFSEPAQRLLAGAPSAAPEPPAPAKPAPRPAGRSDAITMLAVLQREARLVDFIKEPIASYSDAQIGAAVRDVHRDCAAALERMLALRPIMEQAEGSDVNVPAGFDAGRIRLTGNVSGQPPYRGALQHQGWAATRVELPAWSGSEPAANVVAPAEVELT